MSLNEEKKNVPSAELQKLVELWLRWDQCDQTRKEIEEFKNKNKWDDLEVRLSHRIQFGTAGLRAKMGGGFALMNELTVIQATQGLLREIQKKFPKESLSVVIGFDARHQSQQFARLASSLFAHEGIQVYLFDSKTVPTPFIPYSVQKLKCHAGIMVTASHNPKDDNGYKVYWQNGAQIISPLDSQISDSIESNLEPWKDKAWNLNILKDSKLVSDPIEKIRDLYVKNLSKLCYFPELNASSSLKFVYTPVHGVGQPYAEQSFGAFHFKPFISVDKQKDPDPNFSTVKYPNPEEGKETLECAIQVANQTNADFILATDPDADRFALAERGETSTSTASGWRILTGNQLGALLGWWRWFTWRNRNPDVDLKDVYMLYSTVSSHILKSIAEVEGFNIIETLTGFKWLGNQSHQLIQKNKHVLFAFEEAIGFMCDPENVLDKDGISALAVGAEMCNYLKSIGRTLYEQLEEISLLYGYHINNNSYVICNQTDRMLKMFYHLRHYDQTEHQTNQDKNEGEEKEEKFLVQYSNKIKSHLNSDENDLFNSKKEKEKEEYVYPKSCNNYEISGVRDLTVGIEADFRGKGKDQKPSLPCSKSTEMITFYFDNGCEITIRASGTEPKIKWYSEIRKKKTKQQILEGQTNLDNDQFRKDTKEELDQLVQSVLQLFLQPKKNGLIERETTAK